FLYVHPERLSAASIGAPGSVTLLEDSKPWWIGTGGIASIFGRAPDIPAMRKVRVQMIVGADDVETWEITHDESSRRWMPGVNDCGRTRIDRLRALCESFRANGITVRLDLVPGVGHQEHAPALVACVEDFMAAALSKGE